MQLEFFFRLFLIIGLSNHLKRSCHEAREPSFPGADYLSDDQICYLDIANNTGIKTSEILLRHGYPPTIVQILVRFASTGWIGSDEIYIQVPSSMNNTNPEFIH